jgi:hypothetical protein
VGKGEGEGVFGAGVRGGRWAKGEGRQEAVIDADIYLDVDGVLFCENDGILELRDGFLGFLWFLVNNFANCYWLTCWGMGFNDVLNKVYGGKIAAKFQDSHWKHCSIDKASGIQDWNRQFVWIEDGLFPEAMEELKRHGCENNYIHVPFHGEMHKLYEVKEELKHRFNIKIQEVEKV